MIKIYPYKMGSRSATALARSLDARKVYPDRNYRPRPHHLIVNWGCSGMPVWLDDDDNILNHPDYIGCASNKLEALNILNEYGVTVPDFTTDREEAQRWLDANNGSMVVERHRLQGHSGEGIELKEFGQDVAPAPLYTKYIKKSAEYRVHVFNGEVIDVQQKRKRQETPKEEVDFKVRNHQNGWVYCREDITEPDNMREISINAINALGLDFGAVDIIYNTHHNQCYVLEVNTACGLEGTTLEKYTNAIKQYAEERGF